MVAWLIENHISWATVTGQEPGFLLPMLLQPQFTGSISTSFTSILQIVFFTPFSFRLLEISSALRILYRSHNTHMSSICSSVGLLVPQWRHWRNTRFLILFRFKRNISFVSPVIYCSNNDSISKQSQALSLSLFLICVYIFMQIFIS